MITSGSGWGGRQSRTASEGPDSSSGAGWLHLGAFGGNVCVPSGDSVETSAAVAPFRVF